MTETFDTLSAKHTRRSLVLILAFLMLYGVLFGLIWTMFADRALGFSSKGMLAGFLAAFALLIFNMIFGSRLLTFLSAARRIERFQDRVLFNVTEEMAIAAGIPMPKIYVIWDEAPNAFAVAQSKQHAAIGITTGLRKKLNRDELQAVIAHEIAHIRNGDSVLMTQLSVLAGLLVLVADLSWRRVLDILRPSLRQRGLPVRSKAGVSLSILAFLGVLAFAWLTPLLAKLLQFAVSREREYLADAEAIRLCRNPLALAKALRKIALDPLELHADNRATEHLFIINPSIRRRCFHVHEESLWSTHPPVLKRIARLNQMARSFEESSR